MESSLARISNHWGAMVALALLIGAGVVVEPLAVLALALAVPALFGTLEPRNALALVFGALLLDRMGATGFNIAGIPLTASKLLVGLSIVSWLLRATVTGVPLVRPHYVHAGLGAIILTTMASLATTASSNGVIVTLGIIMLSTLVVLVSSAIQTEDLIWLFRIMSFMMIAMFLWTLVFGEEEATKGRPVGNIGDPNYWATQMLLICPLLLASLNRDPWRHSRWLLYGIAILYPLCMAQTLSRAGFLVFVATLPVLVYLLRDRREMLVPALMVVVAIPMVVDLGEAFDRMVVLLNPEMEEELGMGRSIEQRTLLLTKAIDIFKNNWLHGVGVGLFPVYAAEVILFGEFKGAHNSYATVAAEQGIIGLLAHAILGALVVQTMVTSITHAKSARLRALAIGFAASMGSFGLMAFTLNLHTFATGYYFLGLGLVINAAAREEARTGEPAPGMASG